LGRAERIRVPSPAASTSADSDRVRLIALLKDFGTRIVPVSGTILVPKS
jgi:hypothetical protein